MNGLQIIEKLREDIKTLNKKFNMEIQEPLFVITSAYFTPHFKNHLLSLGIRHIYDKPMQNKELKFAVDEALNNKKTTKGKTNT